MFYKYLFSVKGTISSNSNLKSYIFQIHIVYTELERYLILDKIFCDETQDDLINTNWYPLIFLI